MIISLKVTDLNLDRIVQKGIEELNKCLPEKYKISLASFLQRGMWLTILRQKSIVAIRPDPNNYGFIIPAVNLLISNQDMYPMNPAQDPRVIIFCSNWKSVEHVTRKIDCLLKMMGDQLTALGVFEREKESAVELMNGVDIFVSTPKSLWRMLEKKEGDYTLTGMMLPCDLFRSGSHLRKHLQQRS